MASSRQRKSNFTDVENEVLLENIKKNSKLLFGKPHFGGASGEQKHLAWLKVAQAVNSVSFESRTLTEIKNRWKKYKQSLKKHSLDKYIKLSEGFTWSPDLFRDDYDAEQSTSQINTTTEESKTNLGEPSLLQSSDILTSQKDPLDFPEQEEMQCEEVCLRWNSHHSNMKTTLPLLLDREKFVDCTISAEGKQLKCHRVILSSCSGYFDEILSDITPQQHPVIFLKGIPFWILKSLIDFMYAGEVHIDQNKLSELLEVAYSLKVKGLAGTTSSNNEPKEEIAKIPETSNKISSVHNKHFNESRRSSDATSEKSSYGKTNEIMTAQSTELSGDDPESLFKNINKKQLSRKFRKRKLSEHDMNHPPVLLRKGTKSRPNVKVPKHLHQDFESADIKQLTKDPDGTLELEDEELKKEEYNAKDEKTKILEALHLRCKTPTIEENNENTVIDLSAISNEETDDLQNSQIVDIVSKNKTDVEPLKEDSLIEIESEKCKQDLETEQILLKIEKHKGMEITAIKKQ